MPELSKQGGRQLNHDRRACLPERDETDKSHAAAAAAADAACGGGGHLMTELTD